MRTFDPRRASGKSQQALAWLGGEPGFELLRERARRLAAIQADLRTCVPGLALQVLSLEEGVLVVGASQASAAAKIRQFTPSILAGLTARGWRIEKLRFKPRFETRSGPPPRQKETPGAAAVASVAALAETVSDPRLSEALRRLARRHGAD